MTTSRNRFGSTRSEQETTQRRYPQASMDILREEVIRRTVSPYCSPLWVLPSHPMSKGIRVVVDFGPRCIERFRIVTFDLRLCNSPSDIDLLGGKGGSPNDWTVVASDISRTARILQLRYKEALGSAVRQVITFLGIDNCTTPSPNYMSNVAVLRAESGRSYMKADIIINKIIEGKTKWRVESYKCEDRHAIDCEYFLKIDMDLCPAIIKKGEIWTPYFNSSQPKFICPINQKMYRFSKIMLDTEKLFPMTKMVSSVTDFYWKVKVRLIQMNPTVTRMCYVLKLKMDTTRS
ncbi:hypothetical protein AAG570_011391 [Ranatra chinensis]|uniref:Uncharacterized protein n=1 Tax=Ranatra chinensis TaxID=642074 RepID=A0ABD0YKH3_9HEMI